MANKLLATVDIGSMSCIMLIAAFEDGKLVPKLQKVKICKLGEDIYEHGRITEKKIQELVDVMTSFRMDLHALGADIQAAAMTEAMRKAENQEEVVDAVEKALWFRPRIISGEEEGKLTYRSVKEWHGEGIVTIDIGGGSTELSNGETTFSIPVGALKMFKAMGPIPGPEYKKFVKETFKEVSLRA
jgi:exopolyphosphatase/guanosine-5'-triphosphate,3'-diphosphate pyrophosphatase